MLFDTLAAKEPASVSPKSLTKFQHSVGVCPGTELLPEAWGPFNALMRSPMCPKKSLYPLPITRKQSFEEEELLNTNEGGAGYAQALP